VAEGDPSLPEQERLWQAVLASWGSTDAHLAFLDRCHADGQLPLAAARYRAALGDPAHAEEARRRLATITMLALQALEGQRSEPRRGLSPALSVALSLPVVALAAYALYRMLTL
jgi:hypothetical protein